MASVVHGPSQLPVEGGPVEPPPDSRPISKRPRRDNTARAAHVGTIAVPRGSHSDLNMGSRKLTGRLAIPMHTPSNLSRHPPPAIILETNSSGRDADKRSTGAISCR